MEVILLTSTEKIYGKRLAGGDFTGELSMPIYMVEFRGRIPLYSQFIVPAYVISNESVELLMEIARDMIGRDPRPLAYLYMDMVLSQRFLEEYGDLIESEVTCIEMCPSPRLNIQLLITLGILSTLALVVIYIRRRWR